MSRYWYCMLDSDALGCHMFHTLEINLSMKEFALLEATLLVFSPHIKQGDWLVHFNRLFINQPIDIYAMIPPQGVCDIMMMMRSDESWDVNVTWQMSQQEASARWSLTHRRWQLLSLKPASDDTTVCLFVLPLVWVTLNLAYITLPSRPWVTIFSHMLGIFYLFSYSGSWAECLMWADPIHMGIWCVSINQLHVCSAA